MYTVNIHAGKYNNHQSSNIFKICSGDVSALHATRPSAFHVALKRVPSTHLKQHERRKVAFQTA